MIKGKSLLAIVLLISLCFPTNVFAKTSSDINYNNDKSIKVENSKTGQTMYIDLLDSDIQKSKKYEGGEEIVVISVAKEFEVSDSKIMPFSSVEDVGSTVRITMDVVYSNSGSLYLLKKVYGNFTLLDSQMTIFNRKVTYGCYDRDISTQNTTKTLTQIVLVTIQGIQNMQMQIFHLAK